MKILYCRVSTLDQKTDRQRVNERDFDFVIEDKCSCSIPFFEREGGKEILKLITSELTNQEIAEKLSLSVRTIDTHRRNILQKLKVKNTAGLVKYAMHLGMN